MATTLTKNWFVLRVASNREGLRPRGALDRKVKIENLTDLIGRILVPMERIKRVKAGQQKVAERKLYPGYVFVEMELNGDGTIPERAYYVFKDTQGVGDFIGQRNKPTPMAVKDVEKNAHVPRSKNPKPAPPARSRSNSRRATPSKSRKAPSRI